MRAEASEARGGSGHRLRGDWWAGFLAMPAQNETRAGQGRRSGDDAQRIESWAVKAVGVARTSDLRALAALAEVPCTLPADGGAWTDCTRALNTGPPSRARQNLLPTVLYLW